MWAGVMKTIVEVVDPTSAAPWEYVGDLLGSEEPPVRDVTDMHEATRILHEYLTNRVRAVIAEQPGSVALMLSGGVDSIVLAKVLRDGGVDFTTVTVSALGVPSTDREVARRVANDLGVEHIDLTVSRDAIVGLARDAIERIGTPELWEVAAAVPIMLAFAELDQRGIDGPVFTGSGADVLLAGGVTLPAPPETTAAEEFIRAEIFETVVRSFRYQRLVPDFYDRLLGSGASRCIQAFQTMDAWQATSRLHPLVLFAAGPSAWYDKSCLRDLGSRLGYDRELVWTSKSPLQISSGLLALMTDSARRDLQFDGFSAAYADPATEPVEHTVTRYWLKEVASDRSIHG